jgi:hypothetical protein
MFSEETIMEYIHRREAKLQEVWENCAKSKKGKLISFSPYPITRAKKIWSDFMCYGFVRDERGLDNMIENILDKIITLDVLTTMGGHTPEDPKNFLEEIELTYDEVLYKKFLDYMCDEDGCPIISDYALVPLQKLAVEILGASTSEAKLLLIDQVLNVVHQRSDLASWFVQGGRKALEELSNQNVLT